MHTCKTHVCVNTVCAIVLSKKLTRVWFTPYVSHVCDRRVTCVYCLSFGCFVLQLCNLSDLQFEYHAIHHYASVVLHCILIELSIHNVLISHSQNKLLLILFSCKLPLYNLATNSVNDMPLKAIWASNLHENSYEKALSMWNYNPYSYMVATDSSRRWSSTSITVQ